MNKRPLILSSEEVNILYKLSTEQLRDLAGIRDMPGFLALKDMVNIMIDIDKNYFFGENEMKITPQELAVKHAFSRGGIAKLVMLIHLIGGVVKELGRREQEKEKTKENRKAI